jgi:hypothetical protein
MPVVHTLLPKRRLLLVRLEGLVSVDELVEGQRSAQANGELEPSYRQLVDARDVSSFRGRSEEIRRLSEHTLFEPGACRAIVAPRNAVYGLARVFEAYADMQSQQVKVFRTLPEACSWLGVPIEDIEAALP